MLEDNGYISSDITEKMVAAVGFRNLIVHEYVRVDLRQVYQIAHNEIEDLQEFVQVVLKNAGID